MARRRCVRPERFGRTVLAGSGRLGRFPRTSETHFPRTQVDWPTTNALTCRCPLVTRPDARRRPETPRASSCSLARNPAGCAPHDRRGAVPFPGRQTGCTHRKRAVRTLAPTRSDPTRGEGPHSTQFRRPSCSHSGASSHARRRPETPAGIVVCPGDALICRCADVLRVMVGPLARHRAPV